ncbi:ABC transporter permease [Streptomyces sp. NPDC102381]|uniref:ABC transporter permease n=1 Tax=Streptomyces sp. NPDC102381 TaxID=3366164 RepID=UPI0038219A63
MKIYLIEVRRSPLLWFFPVLLIVDLAAVFGRSQWWIGVWPEASAAAQIPALFFAPVAAAAAAWSVGRVYRRGVAELQGAAAQAKWKMELAQFSATLTYCFGAYAVGALAAAAVTFSDGGSGFLWPSYLFLGAGAILACAAVGHFTASLWHAPFVAPVVCGLSCFLVISVVGTPNNLGLFVLSGSPTREVDTGSLAARLALSLSLALLAVFGSSSLRRNSLWKPSSKIRVLGIGLVSAAVLSAAVVVTVGPTQKVRAAPQNPLCTHGEKPRVCVWPEHRKYLAEVDAMAKRLKEIPQKWIKMPGTFYELGLRGQAQGASEPSGPPRTPRDSQMDFEILEGNMWFVSPSLAGSIMQLSIPNRCDAWDPNKVERLSLAAFEVETWLEYRANGSSERNGVNGGPPGVKFSEIQRVSRSDEGAQARWVARRLKVISETPCAR